MQWEDGRLTRFRKELNDEKSFSSKTCRSGGGEEERRDFLTCSGRLTVLSFFLNILVRDEDDDQ